VQHTLRGPTSQITEEQTMHSHRRSFNTLRHSEQIAEIKVSREISHAVSETAIKAASGLTTTIEQAPYLLSDTGAEILAQNLDSDALAALGALGRPSQASAVVLRSTVDLGAPETPTSGFTDDRVLVPHDLILAGAMKLAGTEPIAFSFENSGKIARNVVSNPLQRGKASSHGFDVELFWHQDNCGQPFENEQLPGCDLPAMPEQLAFLAVRNNERIPTRLLLVDDALQSLAASTIATLSRPLYTIGAPDSVAADGFGTVRIENAPILRFEQGFMAMRYDPFLVSTKDPAAILAHARLAIALEEMKSRAIDITLSSGDLLIFKNYRVLHMRVAFEPCEPAQSRWLRRFYGRARS
jgi:L-asparagine oxygenase